MKKQILFMFAILLTGSLFAQTARVQVIHNSADALAAEVDVYIDAGLAIDNFAFRTATEFLDLPAGVEIELSIAPGNSMSVNDALITVPVTLMADEKYIVIADGIVSPTGYNPAPPVTLQVYAMAREEASNPSNTDVLVHHGSTDAPTVDVVETGAGAGTIVDDISYTEYQGYLELPTADYVLEIREETGTTGVAAFQAPLSTLSLDGAALVVIASGFLDPSQNSNGAAFGLFVALPAGGALVELPSASLGVNEFADPNSFVVYPNPASNVLNFTATSSDISIYTASMIDMQGRVVKNIAFEDTTGSIDVSDLATGLYQLVVRSGADVLVTKKFVKK